MSEAQSGVSRESILRRLKALAQKTVENGCSEAEALSSSEMLAKLMDRYDFDHADLGASEHESITQNTIFAGEDIGNLKFVAPAVASYCDIKLWSHHGKSLVLLGRESDKQLAEYMLQCFRSAMKSGWKDYLKSVGGSSAINYSRHKINFERAMMGRLTQRLLLMKAARSATVDTATGRTGTSLVVVKSAAVKAAFAQLDLNLKTARTRRYGASYGAGEAGRAAGDKVHIGTGIANGSQALLG